MITFVEKLEVEANIQEAFFDLQPYYTPHVKLEKDDICYDGKGENYRGIVSKTKSGYECQPWSHQIRFNPLEHPEIAGGHNYCRNPNGENDQPWCFSKDLTEPLERTLNFAEFINDFFHSIGDSFWMYIVLPLFGGIFILCLVVSIICLYQYIAKLKKSPGSNFRLTDDKAADGSTKQVEMSSLLPANTPAVRSREFPMSSIRFQQELGEGAFGKVYKGEVMGVTKEGIITPVAIKTLKANATQKTMQDFRREVDLMTDLRHNNIVCLIGVCIKEEPMCMLFEFMSKGDLHEFLIIHSPQTDVSVYGYSDDGQGHILDIHDFLYMATQIAAGMEYLTAHHYVHRDLAARNCLVGETLTVKISDFGLSRDIYSCDYYRVQSKSLLPVRWMPPESILYGKFTTESDAWSFGVVLWEIFSYGLQPYYGYSNQEVIEMIRSRHLLPCPEECPPHVYGMMLECWNEIPVQRPKFRELHTRLHSWQVFHSEGMITTANGHVMCSRDGSQYSTSMMPSNITGSTNLTGGGRVGDVHINPLHHRNFHSAYPNSVLHNQHGSDSSGNIQQRLPHSTAMQCITKTVDRSNTPSLTSSNNGAQWSPVPSAPSSLYTPEPRESNI
ncbi:Inactive tyrosine-protein kinase transmembrane receptor ROR1 [Nymphon striatum]|nr:Inactive tyrosine-protein kinase transmembrane receptor ROR1 [Nymphon striatum]